MSKFALSILAAAAMILMPDPLSAQASTDSSVSESAFEIRGMKGLFWDGIEKYYKAVPWMADHDMNWLMLCYSAYPESGKDWRKDYTPEHLAEMKELVTRANDKGITVCLSFNPGIWSKPPLCHSCEEDYQAAWRKVTDAHKIGIYSIALCLDDISRELVPADKEKYGTLQAAQIAFVNRMWDDMQQLSPRPHLIFCPSAYTTADMKRHMDYTLAVGNGIAPEIDIFWTGPEVVSKTITVADAAEVEGWLKRQPFIWDNYPVNDMFPWRPLLAPLKGRSPDLAGAVSGILFNPMMQWEATKIPMVSVANYLRDPANYDAAAEPQKLLAEYPEQDRLAIKLLVKYYGSSFVGEPGYPPGPNVNDENAKTILEDLTRLRQMTTTGSPAMQALWQDVKDTVEPEINNLELLTEGQVFRGENMTGGAPELAKKGFGSPLALVYAQPTGKSVASAEIAVDTKTIQPTRIRLMARNGDMKVPGVRITMNGQTIVEGKTEFSQEKFEPREFMLPENAIKNGKTTLRIENLETSGTLGMPPWFAVKWVQFLP